MYPYVIILPPSHTLIDINMAFSIGPRVGSFRPYPNALDLEFPLPTCQKPNSDWHCHAIGINRLKVPQGFFGAGIQIACEPTCRQPPEFHALRSKKGKRILKASTKSSQRQPQHPQGKGLAHEMAQGPTTPASQASQELLQAENLRPRWA